MDNDNRGQWRSLVELDDVSVHEMMHNRWFRERMNTLRRELRREVVPATASFELPPGKIPRPVAFVNEDHPALFTSSSSRENGLPSDDRYDGKILRARELEFLRSTVMVQVVNAAKSMTLSFAQYHQYLDFFRWHDVWRAQAAVAVEKLREETENSSAAFRETVYRLYDDLASSSIRKVDEILRLFSPTLAAKYRDSIERWRMAYDNGIEDADSLLGDSPVWGLAPDALSSRIPMNRLIALGLDVRKAYNTPYWVELPEQWPVVLADVPEYTEGLPARLAAGYGSSANALFKTMARDRWDDFGMLTESLRHGIVTWEEQITGQERPLFREWEDPPDPRQYPERSEAEYAKTLAAIPPKLLDGFRPRLIDVVQTFMGGREKVNHSGAVSIRSAGRLYAAIYAALLALIGVRRRATLRYTGKRPRHEVDLRYFVFNLSFEILFVVSVPHFRSRARHQHRVLRVSSPFSFARLAKPDEDPKNDKEWGLFVRDRKHRDYLEMAALMAQWVLNTVMTPLYRLVTGERREYDYGEEDEDDPKAEVPLPPESLDEDGGFLYPATYTAFVDSLKLVARKKILRRTVNYHTLMLNLFSESPSQWRWVREQVDGRVPDVRKSRTECAYLACAAAYCVVHGVSRKSAGTRAKRMKKRSLELFGEDFVPTPGNFFEMLSALAAPGGYPERGWRVPNIPVRVIAVDLASARRHPVTREMVLAWDDTPEDAILNPVEDEQPAPSLVFLSTSEHMVLMVEPENVLLADGGETVENPEFTASDIISEHRLIEPLPDSSFHDEIEPVVVVYDLETLNSTDGFEGTVQAYAAGWAVGGLYQPFICTVDRPEPTASPDEQMLQISPLKRMLYYMWKDRRIPFMRPRATPKVYLVAHNGSGFDHYLLFRSILENATLGFGVSARISPHSIIRRGGNIMAFTIELRKGKRVKYLRARDTFLFWHASLDKIGKALGCSISKSEFPYEKVTSLEVMWVDSPLRREMEEYLQVDVLLLLEIVEKMRALFQDLFDIEMLKSLTISAIARKLFFRDYFREPGVPDEERVICPSLELDSDYRDSFFGGRNEMFWKGTFHAVPEEGIDLWYIDATSLYPSVMGQEEYPVGLPNSVIPTRGGMLDELREVMEDNGVKAHTHTCVIKCSMFLSPVEGSRARPVLARRAGFDSDGKPRVDKGRADGSRLVFAWGNWEGWLTLPEFDYIVANIGVLFEVEDFFWTRVDIYLSSGLLQYTVKRLFALKSDIDKRLNPTHPDYASLSSDEKIGMGSQRQVIKIMINSLYGFWAIKVTKNRSFDVADSTATSYIAAMRSEYALCWTETFDKQTVFEYDSVLESGYRNVLIGMWTSAQSRLRLYKMLVEVEKVPWRHALYADTDSVHVLDAHRFEHPNFWDDVIMRDPAYSRNSELGGWTNEMQDKMRGRLGKLTKLSIIGLKLYSYTIEYPDGEVVHGYKSRGISSKWLFKERFLTDSGGRKSLVYKYNYSSAYHKMLQSKNPEYEGPVSVSEQDLTDLAEGKLDSIVCVVYAFRAGGAALSRAESPMTRMLTHRTLQMVEHGKGVVGEVADLPGSANVFPILPYVIT